MNRNWLDHLMETNKELLLIFSILAFAAIINFFVSGQKVVLSFYDLPTLFAAYYFGRARAMQTAVASLLIVGWVSLMNPRALVGGWLPSVQHMMAWSDLAVWGSFLLIVAYAMGTLYEQKEHSLRELQETYSGVLQILCGVVSNDQYTHTHSHRTSIYAARIGEQMGLPEERIEDIRAAALLHDIGKLEISRPILYKAAKLTDQEVNEVQSHLNKGVEKLSLVGGTLRRVLPIILSHHDKFDGSGYRGSKGVDIPLESRIISVADTYDSLVSDRPYRKAMSPFEARDVIKNGAGKDFDPEVVKAFELAFRSGRMEVAEVLA
jgi:HD-GYP domain-containing protein (c-di-GMP phosphodiesterase class II)